MHFAFISFLILPPSSLIFGAVGSIPAERDCLTGLWSAGGYTTAASRPGQFHSTGDVAPNWQSGCLVNSRFESSSLSIAFACDAARVPGNSLLNCSFSKEPGGQARGSTPPRAFDSFIAE